MHGIEYEVLGSSLKTTKQWVLLLDLWVRYVKRKSKRVGFEIRSESQVTYQTSVI